MFFVLVYVCSMGLTQTCLPVQEQLVPGYVDKAQCERQVRKLTEAIKEAESTNDPRIHAGWPKRPWKLKGYCICPVVDETFIG